jgi:F-type H+-transporting ATPase subunit b
MKRARYLISLFVVLSVLFAYGTVLASSEGGGHGDAGHGGESAFNKNKDLVFRIMNFALLVGVLFFLLRKPVSQGLEARRQGIKDELDDLERQKEEAQKQLAETKQKLSQLDAEVQRIVAEYVQMGEAAKAKILEEARASADKLQEQAKKNIEHEFGSAKQQLMAEMADQAVAMAEELIRKNIQDQDQERIIDEYLEKVVVAQ